MSAALRNKAAIVGIGTSPFGRHLPQSQLALAATAFRAALDDDAISLIDTRDLRQHIGLKKKDYVYAPGHIPGSEHMPYKFLHAEKGSMRFLEPEAYTDLLHRLGIEAGNGLIFYCNSAYEASSTWFVLHELLGVEDVRIYDGSLHQWTQYESNPMTARLTE